MKLGQAYALALLSSHDSRLDDDAIIIASAGSTVAVSHDPRGAASSGKDDGWLEVIVGGMTFDISGLRPAPGITADAAEHHYDLGRDVTGRAAALPIIHAPHLFGA